MDLEGLGKAISEAIALRAKMAAVEMQGAEVVSQINSNRKEINRLKSLQVNTGNLVAEEEKIKGVLSELKIELGARMVKLNKAGVTLPLSSTAPNVVSL